MTDDPRPKLLITRPLAGGRRFKHQFRERFGADWPVVLSPLVALRPTNAPPPPTDEYIFTSEQAVFVTPPDFGKRAWCVGVRTAEAAHAAGFNAIEGPGDAAGLWRLLVSEAPDGRLLHVRGAEIAAPLGSMLRDVGMDVIEVVAYQQERLPLSPEALTVLHGTATVLVPVFSPRSGVALVDTAPAIHAPLLIGALSAAVQAATTPLFAAQTVTAQQPNANGMLDALEQLIEYAG